MATSGTYVFNPDLAEIVDEAFERCRVDPANISARHILSARRSMRFMLVDWAAEDYQDFRIRQDNFTLVQSQAAYVAGTDFDLDAGGVNIVDILGVVLRRDGVDTPVEFMSRHEQLNIPEKSIEGRPDRVFIDKGRDGITLTFWTVPENSTDVIYMNVVRKFEDSDKAADNADISWYMEDAMASGLAARLAAKYAPPDLEQALWTKAAMAFKKGTHATQERGDVRIVPVSGYRRRRGSGGRFR